MSDVAIILPGGNYTPLGPAIRFPVLAALEAGYRSSVAVEYPPQAMRDQDLEAVVGDVRRQLDLAVNFDESARVTVIAKSMGSRVVVQISDLLDRFGDVSVVWLTPLFGDPGIRDAAIRCGWRSLIAFGDEDPAHDEAGVAAVSHALKPSIVRIAGADHALEIPGDLHATMSGLHDVAVAVQEFLAA